MREWSVKPWPNGLASQRKFVQLAFRLAKYLHRLASPFGLTEVHHANEGSLLDIKRMK